jgi:hypothetical protein
VGKAALAMDEMKIVAKLPMRAHLWKYALWVAGIKGNETITMKGNDLLPTTLRLLSCYKRELYAAEQSALPRSFSHNLLIELMPWQVRQGKIFFTSSAVWMFDRFINQNFHNHIRVVVERNIHQVSAKEAIAHELERIGITEDDVQFETVTRKAVLYRQMRGESIHKIKTLCR